MALPASRKSWPGEGGRERGPPAGDDVRPKDRAPGVAWGRPHN
jgi:hypothetical protein